MDRSFDREGERNAVIVELAQSPQARRDYLIAQYRSRSEAAFSSSSLRNYRQIIKGFNEWCASQGYSAVPPVEPVVIAEYVESLGGKIRATTIGTRLWAIAELHRSHFQTNPCRHRLVELALKGVKRRYGATIRQAPPLCKQDVLQAIDSLGSGRRAIRDKAYLWIATDSWCRASEITQFRVRDLLRQDDGSSLLYVARSKTDQFGEGAYAYLSERGTEAVLEWVSLAGLRGDDPLLTKSQRGGKKQPLHAASLSRILKKCLGRDDVSAHSTRIGGVHDAMRIGCDLSSIMIAGRWSSPEMPARYGRRILASNSAAARVSQALGNPDRCLSGPVDQEH